MFGPVDWRREALKDRVASGLSSQDGSGLVAIPSTAEQPRMLVELGFASPRTMFVQIASNLAATPFLFEVGVRRSVMKFRNAPAAIAIVGGVWVTQPITVTVIGQWCRVTVDPTPNVIATSVCQAQAVPGAGVPETIEIQLERIYKLLASGAEIR